MKKLTTLFIVSLFFVIGSFSCQKNQVTDIPQPEGEQAVMKALPTIPWAEFKWAKYHKAGTDELTVPPEPNQFFGLDLTDYLKERIYASPAMYQGTGQFVKMFYYNLKYEEVMSLIEENNFDMPADACPDYPEKSNIYLPHDEFNDEVVSVINFLEQKLAWLCSYHGVPNLKIKYVNFEQIHWNNANENPFFDWKGNCIGLYGFYYGTWYPETYDPSLNVYGQSIPWNNYRWAATHKEGNIPASPPATEYRYYLDATDLIEEKCSFDPELIPQHGTFHDVGYYKVDYDEWRSFLLHELWTRPTCVDEDHEYQQEWRVGAEWEPYAAHVKQFVLNKLSTIPHEDLYDGIRVKSINIGTTHHEYPDTPHNPFVKGGHYHALYGFYYGYWEDN